MQRACVRISAVCSPKPLETEQQDMFEVACSASAQTKFRQADTSSSNQSPGLWQCQRSQLAQSAYLQRLTSLADADRHQRTGGQGSQKAADVKRKGLRRLGLLRSPDRPVYTGKPGGFRGDSACARSPRHATCFGCNSRQSAIEHTQK